jgi:hypothetical protein
MPRSTALRYTREASMPAPSSMMVITTWLDSWAAESRMVPGAASLPAGHALAGGLDAVVHAVADQVDERLSDLVDDGLVHPRRLALEDQLDLLALLAGQVPHQPGKRSKTWRTGSMRMSITGLLEHRGDPAHVLDRGHQLPPAARPRHRLHQSLSKLDELGAAMISSPTRFSRWSSCEKSTRTGAGAAAT